MLVCSMGTYVRSTQHRDPCTHTGKINLVLYGAAESHVIARMVGTKPQQPVVPHSEESTCLIPKGGQQWGKELKKIISFFSVDKQTFPVQNTKLASLCSNGGKLTLWDDPVALSPILI